MVDFSSWRKVEVGGRRIRWKPAPHEDELPQVEVYDDRFGEWWAASGLSRKWFARGVEAGMELQEEIGSPA